MSSGNSERRNSNPVTKAFICLFLFFTAMTQNDLLQVWAEEGKAALEAKKSGMVLDLWKVVAERKVATFSHSHIVSNTLNGSRWTLENRHVHFSVP